MQSIVQRRTMNIKDEHITLAKAGRHETEQNENVSENEPDCVNERPKSKLRKIWKKTFDNRWAKVAVFTSLLQSLLIVTFQILIVTMFSSASIQPLVSVQSMPAHLTGIVWVVI